eukprot:TRINITY_DN10095_c0_g1_i2.p1 TRINITY_DN10095_c0_g1~~TRINITY_DN10095_c0_g1_i2.p1  ORF type:complete len:622 (+),score=136.57 TRINITY_DN10095_c0_g1_i2:31-1866(+)
MAGAPAEGGTDDANSPAADGGAPAGKTAEKMPSLLSLAESSPRYAAVLDAPMANPVFMSDVPSFLHRQRTRACRAIVSEHTETIVCPCQKCLEQARSRTGPFVSSAWPLPPLEPSFGSRAVPTPPMSTTSKKSAPGKKEMFGSGTPSSAAFQLQSPRKDSEAAAKEEPRDFVWLLRVLSEMVPSQGKETYCVPGVFNYDGTFTPDPDSLLGKLGVLMPDTVIIEKGKPVKRYNLDFAERIQATKMKTSAELLRVLRDFVRKATRPREVARSRTSSKNSMTGMPGISKSRSEGSLQPRRPSKEEVVALDVTEVAVLHYNDGLSRLMMRLEAVNQMKGASKLPREFWQHIRMLQLPVQSRTAGVPTRYITYSFDANSLLEPQEPMPLGGGARMQLLPPPAPDPKKMGFSDPPKRESEAARMASLPRLINEYLATKGRKHCLQMVSGQLEFVLDEADGMLWLVNAHNLRCKTTPRAEQQENNSNAGEIPLFFEEDEFEADLREHEVTMEQLKKRFGGDPGVASGGAGVAGITVSASDELAGVTVPTDLYKYYEEEEKMLHYFTNEVKPMAERREKIEQGARAVGLGCWFRRWQRGMKKALRQREKHKKANGSSP